MCEKFCMSAYVYGWYKDFISLYIYSILKAYPDYFVKVFVPDKLTEKQKISLNICKRISNNFDVVEQFQFNENVDFSKCARWFLPRDCFHGFDYAYIGDIDIMIVREKSPLLQSHIDHCRVNNLCYSNMVRDIRATRGIKKLSGLHFFCVNPYYDVLKKKMENSLSKGIGNKHNETVLYELIDGSFEFPKDRFRPHHGYHLGCLRDGNRGIFRSEYYLSLKEASIEIFESDDYEEMMGYCDNISKRILCEVRDLVVNGK